MVIFAFPYLSTLVDILLVSHSIPLHGKNKTMFRLEMNLKPPY